MADSARPSVLPDVQQPQSDTSPREKTAGMVQNFFSLQAPDADTSHTAIKDELVGKLVFDDSRVFVRLGLDHVSSEFVTNCTAAFKTNKELMEARSQLQNTIEVESLATVDDAPLEELVPEELVGTRGTSKGNNIESRKTVSESKMYKPLATIFGHIEDFSDSSQPFASPKNTFMNTHITTLESDASTWGFPKYSPDFVLFEGRKAASTPILWRKTLGFCEVKPTSQHSPKSAKPNTVKPLVGQAGDYARLQLSARPFHLFSVALLIFGSQFCVAIFDRAGVLFSPIHDMWEETGVFVRVIWSLTCLLSPTQLGQDPTVSKLSDAEHKLYMREIRCLGRGARADDFPTFVIMAGGRLWYTQNGQGPVFVLKNTWRSAACLSESDIYGAISGSHPAVAKLHQGSDVLFPNDQRRITAYNLRGASTAAEVEGSDICLHRLLLESRGRPLWEYASEKELLQAMRAALSGDLAPRYKCWQHHAFRRRSVSIRSGRILMDLEFARIDRFLDIGTQTIVPPVRSPDDKMTAPALRLHTTFGPDVLHGAAMTGTAQFMAVPLLRAVVNVRLIKHEPQHDLESFVYVLAYTVARRAVLDSEELDAKVRKRLHDAFGADFGNMNINSILRSRSSGQPLALVHESFSNLFSEPLVALFKVLDSYLALASSRVSELQTPFVLTHEELIAYLDKVKPSIKYGNQT
ncbi:hypothetical protein BDN70DRAFT_934048 [Pholiota conissans]|uniref:Fungal-type protein kinase domain-containing protein n=1 Tax=Pholiota conissans TaxID=109636 RepID=A0A9P5YZR2_9AGAR|nr:hypothetical protein BDN70DRAFT_934048 [Pholiota conissans]